MKLRNKNTGEIINNNGINFVEGNYKTYNSLAELNSEWEDAPEEPKEYWYIEPNGVIARIDEWDCCTDSDIEIMKTLDNYFETQEEAEKAVEKLKAWKRLKDKGFRILGYHHRLCKPKSEGEIGFEMNDYENTRQDLDLLFGGEE